MMNDEKNEFPGQTSEDRGGPARLSRREVLQFFAGTSVMLAAGDPRAFGQESPAAARAAKGYGTDPDLMRLYKPGDVWPLTMSPAQKKAATALADVILPSDELGPAASAVRVPDFIDEWISAPYPDQQKDRPIVITGLKWLDDESNKRFQKIFASLETTRQTAICDDICDPEKAAPGSKTAAVFFRTFRGLAMGAYYSTPPGWKAIGYVGNVVSATFDGPPAEVLRKLGVDQTVE